jgi:uncharacterized protein YcnI
VRPIAAAGIAAAIGALALPAGARAHVSLHPNTLPAGSGPTVDVRVPNETNNARTVEVDVRIPPGFTFLIPEPVPGWTARVRTEKLAKPIKTDDGTVTEQPTEVLWTAGKGRGTPPAEFQNFALQMVVPGKAGAVLTFKTVQTYSNGSVVRWIDAPDGEHPAPTVNVSAEGGFILEQAGDAGPPAPATRSAGEKPTPVKAAVVRSTVTTSGAASKGLGIAALIIAILALIAGVAALATRRKAA